MNRSPSSKLPPVDSRTRERLIESLMRLERFAKLVGPDHVAFRAELDLMARLAHGLPAAEFEEIVHNSGELGGAFVRWLETAPFAEA